MIRARFMGWRVCEENTIKGLNLDRAIWSWQARPQWNHYFCHVSYWSYQFQFQSSRILYSETRDVRLEKTAKERKKVEVAQSCLTLCDPMDCSLPGSSIRGILQARILEWVTISFSRGSSQPRDRTQVSLTAGRRFNLWATREALKRQ